MTTLPLSRSPRSSVASIAGTSSSGIVFAMGMANWPAAARSITGCKLTALGSDETNLRVDLNKIERMILPGDGVISAIFPPRFLSWSCSFGDRLPLQSKTMSKVP